MTEARSLVAAGARITLLGQNVNAYHGVSPTGGEWRLAALIEELVGIPELARLRYTTSHPRDMSPDLIEAHGIDVLSRICTCRFSSDNVLSAMNSSTVRQTIWRFSTDSTPV